MITVIRPNDLLLWLSTKGEEPEPSGILFQIHSNAINHKAATKSKDIKLNHVSNEAYNVITLVLNINIL